MSISQGPRRARARLDTVSALRRKGATEVKKKQWEPTEKKKPTAQQKPTCTLPTNSTRGEARRSLYCITKRYGTLYTETISPEEGEGDEGTPAPIRRHVHGKAEEEETSGAVSLFIWPTTLERC